MCTKVMRMKNVKHTLSARGLRVGIAVLIAIFAVAAYPQSDSDNSWSFVALGDSRSHPETFCKIMNLVAEDKSQPELIFHTGDFVRRGCNKKEWGQYSNCVSMLKGKIPVYPVVGNHETMFDKHVKNYIEFAKPPDGKLYYVVKHKNAGFVVLDSYEKGARKAYISPEQIKWFKDTLAELKSEGKLIFVFIHKPPMVREAYRHNEPLYNSAEVKAIMKDAGVKIMFMGHEHRFDAFVEDGINYILTAGAGAPLYGADEMAFNHYCRVTISPQNIVVTAVDTEGKDKKTITIPLKQGES